MSRRRSALILAIALIFATIGLAMFAEAEWVALLAFILAAAGLIASAMELVTPSQLRLDSTGFTAWRPVRPHEAKTDWTDCDHLDLVQISNRQRLVSYNVPKPARPGRDDEPRIATRYLAAGYDGLTAAQLADLLNGYRERAVRKRELR